MYFEWCSVAVGDTESSASSFLYCISSSSHYAVLPSLLSSNTFIPLHPLTSHTSEQPQPAVFFSQHRISPSSLAVAVSHTLQELGAVALQRGQHHDPAHPALPKQRGWQHRDCSSGTSHPCGVADPQSPTSSPGSTQENGKAAFYSDVAKE